MRRPLGRFFAHVRDWFQSIENSAAPLTAENLFVGFRLEELQRVRQDAHAAATALLALRFGRDRAGMFLGDPVVKIPQLFGNPLFEFRALGRRRSPFLFFLGELSFDLLFVRCYALLRFPKISLDMLHAPLRFL